MNNIFVYGYAPTIQGNLVRRNCVTEYYISTESRFSCYKNHIVKYKNKNIFIKDPIFKKHHTLSYWCSIELTLDSQVRFSISNYGGGECTSFSIEFADFKKIFTNCYLHYDDVEHHISYPNTLSNIPGDEIRGFFNSLTDSGYDGNCITAFNSYVCINKDLIIQGYRWFTKKSHYFDLKALYKKEAIKISSITRIPWESNSPPFPVIVRNTQWYWGYGSWGTSGFVLTEFSFEYNKCIDYDDYILLDKSSYINKITPNARSPNELLLLNI